MRLLYVATDQDLPGSTGGSVHVQEVAEGLSARGHEVHVFARTIARDNRHPARTLLPHRFFRFTAEPAVRAIVACQRIEIVLERYYNFGGEGVRAAARAGIPSVLEVNSPVMDHPGSTKAWIDRFLLLGALRRLREEQCRKTAALVTPLSGIIPPTVPREKVFQIHWGANVERFRPGLSPEGRAAALPIPDGSRVVLFSGSFRKWHGAEVLVRAAARVLEREEGRRAFFLFVGSGPELPAVRARIDALGVGRRALAVGAVPYDEMPFYVARAHVGVAPFEPSRHASLQLGFYWSPLKVFEYMASGLPVVTLAIDPLSDVVRDGRDGLLVRENDVEGLADAVTTLVASPEKAQEMGRSARERVVTHFSWKVHCEKLEEVLERARSGYDSMKNR